MNYPPLHLALRETRDFLMRSQTLSLLAVTAFMLGLIGPFGTFETQSFVTRMGYWLFCLPLTFGVGSFINRLIPRVMNMHFQKNNKLNWINALCSALLTTFAVSLIVVLLNWLFFDLAITLERYIYSGLLPIIMLVTALVSLAISISLHTNAPSSPPPLLKRLEYGKRGPLVSLSVQDHYVEITTTKGSSMVLMRLRDAIEETQGVEGLQIHRSHWVARDHIDTVLKKDAKPFVVLSDSRQLPVSRSYIAALKEAGFLPAKAS